MGVIGDFFIAIGSKFDAKGIQKARDNINKLGRVVAGFSVAFGAAMAFAVKRAIDLEETTAKFSTVFRGVQKEANAMADNLVKSYGVSTEESRRFLSGMQDLLVPMGMNRKAAAEMSDEIVKLSVDIGSFNNAPTEQVMRDIQSAFNGMPLPMRKYGVNITQARIKQEALNLGLIKTGEELSIITKAQAVFSLIQADSSDAQGDFARTSEGLANQLKIMKARWDDVIVAIGEKFMPLAKEYVKIIASDVIPKIKLWAEESGNIESVVGRVASVVKVTTRTLFAFAKTIDFTIQAIKAVNITFDSWIARIFQATAALTGNFKTAKIFGEIARDASDKAKKGYDKLAQSVVDAGEIIDKMNKFELESFKVKEEGKTEVLTAEQEKLLLLAETKAEEETRMQEIMLEFQKGNIADLEETDKKATEAKDKRNKKLKEDQRIEDRRTVNAISQGILTVSQLEILTWRTGTKAFADAMRQRLIQFIMTKQVELIAAKTVALAKAIFNSATTFGAASYQIGIIAGQFALAIGALRAIGSFEKGGIVPGRIGQPQLAVVHGGEQIIPNGITNRVSTIINITVPPITSRRVADEYGDRIGESIMRKLRRNRKI